VHIIDGNHKRKQTKRLLSRFSKPLGSYLWKQLTLCLLIELGVCITVISSQINHHITTITASPVLHDWEKVSLIPPILIIIMIIVVLVIVNFGEGSKSLVRTGFTTHLTLHLEI